MFFLDELVTQMVLCIWVLSVSILKTSFVTELDNWVKSTDYILVWWSSNSLMDFYQKHS